MSLAASQSLTGCLRVRVAPASASASAPASAPAAWVAGLQVRLERPPAYQLFVGRRPAEVLAAVPRLYTLCGTAQTAAARLGLLAVAGEGPGDARDGLPAALHGELWWELLHETLWRLLLDWPEPLGQRPAREAFQVWRRARGDAALAATDVLFRSTLFGPGGGELLAPDALAARCLAALAAWEAADPACADAWLPRLRGDCRQALGPLDPQPWLDHWVAQAAAPIFSHPLQSESDLPPPTVPDSPRSAYCRLLTLALAARQALAEGSPYPLAVRCHAGAGERLAVAQTLTARGVLTHALGYGAAPASPAEASPPERVTRYHVWAPTDRLFAPEGGGRPLRDLLSRLLGVDPHNESRRPAALRIALLTLDPCVPVDVVWLDEMSRDSGSDPALDPMNFVKDNGHA